MKLPILSVCALMLASHAFAGDKTVMHCFAWTPIKEATPADWDAFYKASDALPKKIKGIVRVWYGKLVAPLGQAQLGKVGDRHREKSIPPARPSPRPSAALRVNTECAWR